MSYLSLYRKWRPGAFEEVLGQPHVTETLAGALREGRVFHAYLFAGPRGTGKTSTARILAKALNCERGISATPCGECRACTEIGEGSSLDVFEMDAASHTSVDDIREIRERIPFAAVAGGSKVYIIDEAHQLSTPAFNALLKMLEEPPSHVVFVLCTTESHKLPATVVSRCQRFEFRRHAPGALAEHLAHVAKTEGIEAEDEALVIIARHAHGSARDALSLLDQAAGPGSEGPATVTEATVRELLGEAPEEVLLELGDAIAQGDVLAAFRAVERVVERGWDPRQLLRQLLEHLRALFLARRGADDLLEVDEDHRSALREQAQRFTGAQLEWALRVLGETQADVRWSTHPRLTLEVALARSSRLEAEGAEALRARVERLERHLLTRVEEAPSPSPEKAPSPSPEKAPSPSPEKAPSPSPEKEAPEPAPAVEAKPEPPPIPSPAPVPTPPSDAGLDERWAAFLAAVRTRKRTTHALLREAWPIEVAEGALRVGFEKSFHAEAILRAEHAEHLAGASEEAFGRKLRLRSEVLAGQRPGREATAEAEPGANPVDLVVRGLGAEIVEEVES